jgi:hypothetical protein
VICGVIAWSVLRMRRIVTYRVPTLGRAAAFGVAAEDAFLTPGELRGIGDIREEFLWRPGDIDARYDWCYLWSPSYGPPRLSFTRGAGRLQCRLSHVRAQPDASAVPGSIQRQVRRVGGLRRQLSNHPGDGNVLIPESCGGGLAVWVRAA